MTHSKQKIRHFPNPYHLPLAANRLERVMTFLAEMEKLKMVYRQNGIIDGKRQENSGEHSWHLALMALLLQDYSDLNGIQILRVLKMLLIHDIVEIDAGDTFLYSKKGNKAKPGKELSAAKRIFGLLPDRERKEYWDLWKEFESRRTKDARFAAALDGLQPLLNHYLAGRKWKRRPKIKAVDVLEKKRYIGKASKVLWDYARELIRLSENEGIYLKS